MSTATKAKPRMPVVRHDGEGWAVVWRCCSHLPADDPRCARGKFANGDAGRSAAIETARQHVSKWHSTTG